MDVYINSKELEIKVNNKRLRVTADMIKYLFENYYYNGDKEEEQKEFANKHPIAKALYESVRYKDSARELAKTMCNKVIKEMQEEEYKENLGRK